MFLFTAQNRNPECPGCHKPSQPAPEEAIEAALAKWEVPSFMRLMVTAAIRDGLSIPYCPVCGIIFSKIK